MTELVAALALGVASGMAPGPLHSLILSTALRRGPRPAVRLAFAPLISDAAPVLLSVGVARAIPDGFARGLAIIGGLLVVGLGLTSTRLAPAEGFEEVTVSPARDYLKGAFVNLLNPHPWIFWLGAGAPLLKVAFDRGVGPGAAWLGVFYCGLVGIKLVLAVVVGRGRDVLRGRWLHRSVIASAILLMGVGAWLVWSGIHGFG